MAKKYLLYIHNDDFDKESHKSELVNSLLTDHYRITNNPSQLLETLVESQACKHGYPPDFCKHARYRKGKRVCV